MKYLIWRDTYINIKWRKASALLPAFAMAIGIKIAIARRLSPLRARRAARVSNITADDGGEFGSLSAMLAENGGVYDRVWNAPSRRSAPSCIWRRI